jgi:hypothetical protein
VRDEKGVMLQVVGFATTGAPWAPFKKIEALTEIDNRVKSGLMVFHP